MKQCLKCSWYDPRMQSDVIPPDDEREVYTCSIFIKKIPEFIWYDDKYCKLYFNIDEPPEI